MLDNSSVSNNQMDSEYRTNVSSQERMLTSGDPQKELKLCKKTL
jgi:chromosome segregation ATPase